MASKNLGNISHSNTFTAADAHKAELQQQENIRANEDYLSWSETLELARKLYELEQKQHEECGPSVAKTVARAIKNLIEIERQKAANVGDKGGDNKDHPSRGIFEQGRRHHLATASAFEEILSIFEPGHNE